MLTTQTATFQGTECVGIDGNGNLVENGNIRGGSEGIVVVG